jgi:serine/threonine-protein kinase RsbW
MAELIIEQSRQESGEPLVLYVRGYIDSATVYDLRKKFDELIIANTVNILLDLQALTYLSSAGISAIMEYAGLFQEKGGALALCAVPQKIRKVITMVGLEMVIRVFENQKDAFPFFKPPPQTAALPTADAILPQTGPALSFPLDRACPHCGKQARVDRADIFRCPFCDGLCYVNDSGAMASLAPPVPDGQAGGGWFRITIPSNIVYLNSVRAFLTSVLGESGYRDDDISDIELAIDEALANIMEHAYGMDKPKTVDLSFYITHEYFLAKLRDKGASFDLAAQIKQEQDTLASSRTRGRGCYIINKIMDNIEYQTIPDVGNELVLLRYARGKESAVPPHA